jgi:uncharacterized membrane protein
MKCISLMAAVFLTSLVNLFLYSGGLIGWTYYSSNADSGWDITFTFLAFITNLLIIIIYLNVRKKHLINR